MLTVQCTDVPPAVKAWSPQTATTLVGPPEPSFSLMGITSTVAPEGGRRPMLRTFSKPKWWNKASC